jgi:hypothetical protein
MSLVNCLTLTPNNPHQGKLLNPGYLRDRIVLTPSEYTNIISFIRKIIFQEKKELKLGKKVYLGSSSNLPRHKVKEYFNDNNTKKTSRIEQADTVILDKVGIEKLLHFLTPDTTNNYHDGLFLGKIYIADTPYNKQNLLPITLNYTHYGYKLEDLVSDSSTPFYIIAPSNINVISPDLKPYLDILNSQDLYVSNSWSANREILNIYEAIVTLNKNPNINVVFDEDILTLINSDGLDLDPDYLSTLDSMFESKDQENINLALEMLSNVNIEKHSLTLALFLNRHMDKFYSGSGLNINQNRSFKSFIKYFDSKKVQFKSNWKVFSASLLKKYQDDPKSIKIINSFIIQNINNSLNGFLEIENCTIKLKQKYD